MVTGYITERKNVGKQFGSLMESSMPFFFCLVGCACLFGYINWHTGTVRHTDKNNNNTVVVKLGRQERGCACLFSYINWQT
jgi:hypothetical protein